MYVQRLSLRDYKGFDTAELAFVRDDGEHAGWHVLAGRNGSGKSSVLMAIALALRGERLAYRVLPGFAGLMRIGTPQATISMTLGVSSGHDQFGEGNAEGPGELELGFTVARPDLGGVGTSFVVHEGDKPWVAQGPWLGQPQTGWMLAAYGPQRRLHGHGPAALDLMKESSGVGSIITLFREDASLAEATVWLRELHFKGERAPIAPDRLIELLNDRLLPKGQVARNLDDDGVLIVEDAGVALPLAQLSDGYRSVIALVFDIVYRLAHAYGPDALHFERSAAGHLRLELPGVVLIDEPETHLHASWQRKLGFWLVEHFPRLQFIVTTHSPFICQAALHGSLTRLSPPGDPRPPLRLSGDDYWTVVHGSPNEAMLSELFGLEQLISDESEALRERVAELEVQDLEEGLDAAEQQELARARARLPGAGNDLDRARRLIEGLAGG